MISNDLFTGLYAQSARSKMHRFLAGKFSGKLYKIMVIVDKQKSFAVNLSLAYEEASDKVNELNDACEEDGNVLFFMEEM